MDLTGLRSYAVFGAAVVGAGVIAVTPQVTAQGSPPLVQAPAIALTAGDTEIFAPDTSTFEPTVAEGYPPLDNVLQGSETWDLTGLPAGNSFIVDGVDTQTTFGSFTNDDFLYSGGIQVETGPVALTLDFLPNPTQIDLFDFGGGFENEWIALGTTAASITDTLITPFGDFTLF